MNKKIDLLTKRPIEGDTENKKTEVKKKTTPAVRAKAVFKHRAEKTEQKLNLHAGHRERVRKQLSDAKPENMPPHLLLEYLLYSFTPRRDTNELAHRLIRHFGSLSLVFEATYDELMQIKGLASSAAYFISLNNGVQRSIMLDRQRELCDLSTLIKVMNYAHALFMGKRTEESYLLCLNSEHRLIKSVFLQKGIVNQAYIYIRDIAANAMSAEATNIILCHNHPSGNVNPSSADVEITKSLTEALKPLEITLLDHIIVGKGEAYYSFRQEGQL